MNTQTALNSYAKVHYNANIGVASPHKLIQMLYDGATQRITQAKGAMEYGQIELKGKKINEAISIVNGLRENLNKDEGAELAENMDALYIYIQSILSKAHLKNEANYLDEAGELLATMSSAWREIAPQVDTE